ncbi:MAG: hypothetical protein LBL59_11695 [Xanthomonadaceae bacterium]|jgi:hypothetical protein|nr:hypothetical protein [Xanthomonadaceae bacterium]
MNQVACHIDGEGLFIDGEKIDLPFPAESVVKCNHLFIVKVIPPIGTIYNRNVFAITKEKRIIWQIQESPHGTQMDKPYMNVICDEKGSIIASNWNGVDYLVNPSDGSISVNKFSR